MKTKNHNHKINIYLFWILIVTALVQPGCKKSLKVDLPVDKITAQTVYGSTSSAVAALNGIYIKLSFGGGGDGSFASGGGGLSNLTGLLSDELVDTGNDPSNGNGGFYRNDFVEPISFWSTIYSQYVFRVNSVIEGVSASTEIPDRSKQILLGEAKVLRALIYFNLVNLYGDVPLVTTTDYKTNSNIPRSPKSAVYDQIIKDLKEAQQGLTDQYLGLDLSSSTIERIRPNKAAATALLAKVYLYLGQWQNAEDESTKLINNTGTYNLPSLDHVFLANSSEAIWQLQSVTNTTLGGDGLTITSDARYFIPYTGDMPNVYMSSFLLNAFEANDLRRSSWVRTVASGTDNYPIPNKYEAGVDGFSTAQENTMVFRLGEQYLIRAEARVHLMKITGANSAESDLNAIRTRAGLPGTTATDPTAMLDAIMHERQVELFTEWGNRWYDLKRTGKIDAVMSVVTRAKGGTWEPYKALLPIPLSEFTLNPALQGHQNPGYRER